jgi:glucose-6-phosphate 1-dehydrogenase
MSKSQSDAFVFFGAMGDLAFKKIFPSLQAMIKRGNLNVSGSVNILLPEFLALMGELIPSLERC